MHWFLVVMLCHPGSGCAWQPWPSEPFASREACVARGYMLHQPYPQCYNEEDLERMRRIRSRNPSLPSGILVPGP